jgi:hypothetical protein
MRRMSNGDRTSYAALGVTACAPLNVARSPLWTINDNGPGHSVQSTVPLFPTVEIGGVTRRSLTAEQVLVSPPPKRDIIRCCLDATPTMLLSNGVCGLAAPQLRPATSCLPHR